jgi:tRNA(Ile)-lysidine synthase
LDAVQRLTVESVPGARLGLAVSGGPDSLAMLLLAHDSMPHQIAAATVDHGLRAEAADEACYVAEICAKRGIRHEILKPIIPISGNLQSNARQARYALLEKWADDQGCAFIATAHHADDQLETVLMRLARGSGVDGLSGIRAENGRIIRPLLGFSKAELIAICEQFGVKPIADPSNANLEFDRVKMRFWLSGSEHPLEPIAAVRSASALSEASVALRWMADYLATERIKKDGADYVLFANDLPREVQRRLVLHIVSIMEPENKPRGDTIERTLDALYARKTVTLGNILCKGSAQWRFAPAPARGTAQFNA